MSKKMKVLIAVGVAVLTLVLVGTTVVMAQQPPGPAAGQNALFARVAQILSITQEQLTNAFSQARQELKQEALEKALAEAVTRNIITQGEADQINTWWATRPAAVNKLFGGKIALWRGGDPTKIIDNAVKRNVITQAEADQIKTWWAQRPVAALDKLIKSFAPRGKGWGVAPAEKQQQMKEKLQEKMQDMREKMREKMERFQRPPRTAPTPSPTPTSA